METKKVLVLGGTGAMGVYVVPELLEMYGLTPAHIADAAKRAISLKK